MARQYSGTLGKVGICQIAVSVHAASDVASAQPGWRLFLPQSWDDRSTTDPDAVTAITARRRRSRMPATATPPPSSLALTERSIDYAVAVRGSATPYPGDAIPVAPAHSGRGRRPAPRYPGTALSCKDLVLGAGCTALRTVTWRHGSKADPNNPTAAMRSRFAALRIRPANRDIPRGDDRTLPAVWLLAEWPAGTDEPTDY